MPFFPILKIVAILFEVWSLQLVQSHLLLPTLPEGLYLLMTLALALGAVRLAKEKVLLNSMKGD